MQEPLRFLDWITSLTQGVMRRFLTFCNPVSPTPSSTSLSWFQMQTQKRGYGRKSRHLPSVNDGPAFAHWPTGEPLEWQEHSPQPPPFPQEASAEAAAFAQSHLWQPRDHSVTAARLLGGPVYRTVSQKENIFGSASLGAGGGQAKDAQIHRPLDKEV